MRECIVLRPDTMNQISVEQTTPTGPLRPLALFFRLHWMFGGFAIMFMIAVSMVRHDTALVSGASLGLWLTALSMIAVRYVNISQFHGLTAQGEPATTRDLIAYSLGTLALTAGLWGWALVM